MCQFAVPYAPAPRRAPPEEGQAPREAHDRLVAVIRRTARSTRSCCAPKEIHHDKGDPLVPCVLRKVDQATADALSLGENFAREPMHPQDEAEASTHLAIPEGKGGRTVDRDLPVGVVSNASGS